MTAQSDLDPILAGWFDGDAVSAPPEPLARVIESTRKIRPRPALIARVGSRWVGAGSTNGHWGGLRQAVIVAVVALLAVALAGAALLVGSQLVAPRTPPHTYVNEFTSAPDLSMPMANPALVPLLDGRVLVIGDDGDGGGTGTRALLYDPATGASEPTGPLVSSDTLLVESAVRLKDGRVLVIGNADQVNAGTQVFDPSTLRFAPVGPMITPRQWAAVAVLPDGHVLVAGGIPSGQDAATSSAELFDPDTLTFSTTGSLGTSHAYAAAVILPDGRVFVAPGLSRLTAEVYNPGTGTFSAAGTMSSYSNGDIVIALPDGRVVVFGTFGMRSRPQRAGVWDPTSLTFSSGQELPYRAASATVLDDGRILLVGAQVARWSGTYDPMTGRTLSTAVPKAWGPSMTRLADGRVLVVGGLTDGNIRPEGGGTLAPGVSTVEIFQ